MKRLLTIAIGVLLLAGVAFAEAPAPFEKAKEYATKVQADEDGNYILEYKREGEGYQELYVLGYLSKPKVIIIGRFPLSCGYFEDTGEIKCVAIMGLGYMEMEATQDQIFSFCFSIFRELVSAGVL